MVYWPENMRDTITLEWGEWLLEDIPADFLVSFDNTGGVVRARVERVYLGTLHVLVEDVEKIIGTDELRRQEMLAEDRLAEAREAA